MSPAGPGSGSWWDNSPHCTESLLCPEGELHLPSLDILDIRTLIESVDSWDGDRTVIANLLGRLLWQPTLGFSEVFLKYF